MHTDQPSASPPDSAPTSPVAAGLPVEGISILRASGAWTPGGRYADRLGHNWWLTGVTLDGEPLFQRDDSDESAFHALREIETHVGPLRPLPIPPAAPAAEPSF